MKEIKSINEAKSCLSPQQILLFMETIDTKNLSTIDFTIIATNIVNSAKTIKDNKCVYKFAKLSNAPVEHIVNSVISKGDPFLIFGLVWNVDKKYKGDLARAIISLNDEVWIKVFYNSHIGNSMTFE